MAHGTFMGFSEESTATQLSIEADFNQLLQAGNLDKWMKYMTTKPHLVGFVYDKKVVDLFYSKKVWFCRI